jgi:hypothetical protein
MAHASLAAMVMFQTTAEPDVSRRTKDLVLAMVKEKSTTQIEPDVPLVTHTPELKDKIPSASQTNVLQIKSSHG